MAEEQAAARERRQRGRGASTSHTLEACDVKLPGPAGGLSGGQLFSHLVQQLLYLRGRLPGPFDAVLQELAAIHQARALGSANAVAHGSRLTPQRPCRWTAR